jgi:geranylgeranyl diphosphate synthase type II
LDLKKFLSEKRVLVDGRLGELLPPEDSYPRTLHRAMRYSVFAGGKRLRPALVLAANEAVGGSEDSGAALDTACTFECIHTYSLIHDDLPAIDNDDLRRGKPTCHKVFGEATALLAGDALLTAAFAMISRSVDADGAAATRVAGELSAAAGSTGMIGGQVVDIESEGVDVTFPVLEYIHIHKTGALIRSAVRCGAILGGCTEEDLAAITCYGEAAGLAFQIADDILDVEGSTEVLGKTIGADEARGKATYPALLGLDASKERAAELVERAVGSLSGFGAEAEPLRAIASYITSRTA